MNSLPLTFERDLFKAVAKFKQEHPGVLEARTAERRKTHECKGEALHGAGGRCTAGCGNHLDGI